MTAWLDEMLYDAQSRAWRPEDDALPDAPFRASDMECLLGFPSMPSTHRERCITVSAPEKLAVYTLSVKRRTVAGQFVLAP